MGLTTIIFILIPLAVCMAGTILYGNWRWQTKTIALRNRLESGLLPLQPAIYDTRELETLPPPVQRYFRTVLTEGQPIVTAVRVSHQGQFNLGEVKDQWRPFTSTQWVITHPPGFDWDGTIRLAPGVQVRVHDAYVGGEGILQATLLGLIPLVHLQDRDAVAEGELFRFLAEAAWYPTALLPSQGIHWEAIDDTTARATLTDHKLTVSLEFQFDPEGRISGVRAAGRYRNVKGQLVATPWQCRFWGYAARSGMEVPLAGEVAWELPEGVWSYWRGSITELHYEFASSSHL
uniref:Uncharacterized protein n=1 Tax=Cyanothece sp. (strain PCC 7425 / ATCC 29141) TaxID=395961 RepID=B8HL26_CYAP4